MNDDTPRSRRVPEQWLTLLEQMIDEGIEREGGIKLSAEDLRVEVPLAFGEDADRAEWGFDGSVTVETKGTRGTLAEWFHLHHESLPTPDEDGVGRSTIPEDSDD
ncbi:hypothetical protein [Halobaculum rubrum]|uniref:hypothetical protein n=1 Tax=Halobaculum rubrum TaxID=2872158 RepID=UPI001CA403CE|nr:hypothetical protein [Halobaculum rubrum]QZX99261.1 hypothetical protein K6T25_13510 [Halobaculum rubrum]